MFFLNLIGRPVFAIYSLTIG